MSSSDQAKQIAGRTAAEIIEEGMLVGLGTGSTAAFFIDVLGKRCQEGLRIQAVASSRDSEKLAMKWNIPLIDAEAVEELDVIVDGADEVDSNKNMIKGRGGALFREKLLAQSSQRMVVIVDETKVVKELSGTPLPIEVSRFAYPSIIKQLTDKGYCGTLRMSHEKPFITDNGNYIFDIQYSAPIKDVQKEHTQLKLITGVIETGLFFNIADKVIIGYQNGTVRIID